MQSALRQRMSVEMFEQHYHGKRAELWRGEVREYMRMWKPRRVNGWRVV
jgi:ribosomal protein L16 Arg81 hydroxylase